MANVEGRFFTAAQGTPPTEQQKLNVADLQEKVQELAELIDQHVPEGRNKSLALTSLEDVQMRANRGIFAPQAHR